MIQNLNNYELWEGLIIKVSEGGLTKPAILGNIYRPPRNSIDNLEQFITEFSLLLSSLDQIQHNVIFAGDYNINLLKLNEDELFSDFDEFCLMSSRHVAFLQCVDTGFDFGCNELRFTEVGWGGARNPLMVHRMGGKNPLDI